MERYARITNPKPKSLNIEDVERPRSLFKIVDSNYDGLETLRRIMVQARCSDVKTMVVETLEKSHEIIEENTDLAKAANKPVDSETFRLSFFKNKFSRASEIKQIKDKDFIGYAIVKRDRGVGKAKDFHVYESVINKSPHVHNFIRGDQNYTCHIDGMPFHVRGYMYCQQNGITNVCAHAALRTIAASFLPNNDLSYREINEILEIDHSKREAQNGLESAKMAKVLKQKNINYLPGSFVVDSRIPLAPFQQFIYGHIESGYPVLVFFRVLGRQKDVCHVISVFGHTFNQDLWVPSADQRYFNTQKKIGLHFEMETKYISSDSWLSTFIGHDDAVGSNICVPRHYLQTKWSKVQVPQRIPSGSTKTKELNAVAHIISTLPPKVLLSPIAAELAAARYLSKYFRTPPGVGANKWCTRYYTALKEGQIVLRPLVITGTQYVSHLKRVSCWSKQPILGDVYPNIQRLTVDYPLWMIEISVPELFAATKRKIGEILFRADLAEESTGDILSDRNLFILARLPSFFFQLRQQVSPKSTDLLSHFASGIEEHTEVYGCEEKSALP